jgi:hypothetical protein
MTLEGSIFMRYGICGGQKGFIPKFKWHGCICKEELAHPLQCGDGFVQLSQFVDAHAGRRHGEKYQFFERRV